MTQDNKAAETVDTAAQTEQAPAPVVETGKDGAKKVDLERLINEDGYAEKVLAEGQAQPSEAAPEASEKPQEASPQGQEATPETKATTEQTYIFKDEDGTEERLTAEQMRNRLLQAKHITRQWNQKVAPWAGIVRSTPALAEAGELASRGDRSKLNALIASGQAGPTGAAAKGEDERLDEVVEKLAAKPQFKGWQKEELKANLLAIDAMKQELEAKPQDAALSTGTQNFERDVQEIRSASKELESWLQTVDPEYTANRAAVTKVVEEMRKMVVAGKASREDFEYTLSMYNDPRQRDENGVPYYMRLHNAARAWRAQKAQEQQQQAAAVTGPAARGGVNARMSPSARVSPTSTAKGGLPTLEGKSREERIALMDSFMGV